MFNKQNIFGGIAVLALILSLVGLVGGNQSVPSETDNLGGVTNYDSLQLEATTGNSLVVDTNTLIVDATNNRIGISSTTPSSNLSIGNSGSGTTTIMADKLCLAVKAAGSGSNYIFYSIATSSGNAAQTGWATSTSPCY